MIGIAWIMTFIFPIFSLLFLFVFLIFSKKNKNVYSFLISLSLATIAYLYIPTNIEDLYVHHMSTLKLNSISLKDLSLILHNNIEKIPIIIEYISIKMGNVNFLQFIVTFTSYHNIFLLINRNYKESDSYLKYAIVMFFTLFSFMYQVIFSNLWYILASTFFCLGIYYDMIDKKYKKAIALYIISVLTHSSLIFPVVLLYVFKGFKKKISFKLILILLISFSLIGIVLKFLFINYNNVIITELYNYYIPYFENTKFIESMHPKRLMAIYLIKLVPYFIIYLFNDIKNENSIYNFSIYFSIIIILLYFSSSFSVRFIPLVQLCGIGLLCYCYDQVKEKKYNIFIIMCIIFVGGIWLVYNIRQARYYNFYQIDGYFFKNIVSIIESRMGV